MSMLHRKFLTFFKLKYFPHNGVQMTLCDIFFQKGIMGTVWNFSCQQLTYSIISYCNNDRTQFPGYFSK